MNIRRRFAVRKVVISSAVLVTLAFSLNPEAWSQAANGNCSGGSFSPMRIKSGQTTTYTVYFYCYKNGAPLSDTVTIQILSKLPKGVDFKQGTTAQANATNGSPIVFTTTASTPPRNVNVTIGGMGTANGCGSTYNQQTCSGNFAIKPTITSAGNKSAAWWFNGEQPPGFTMELHLTANPEGDTKYTWNVDGQYGKIEDKSANPTVFKADCPTDSSGIGPCPPSDQGDVSITVTGNGVTSDPFMARVLTPYAAEPLGVPDDDPDPGNLSGFWYFSHIPYQVTDQFGKVLPIKPPVREHFTGDPQSQCSVGKDKCNWHAAHEGGSGEAGRLGKNACKTTGPGVICDTISGQNRKQFGFFASIPTPECPNNNCSSPSAGTSTLKVLCFPGEIWVGNGSTGGAPQGVKIMTLIWQRYQDHARHCNITSPLDGSGTTDESCTCP